MYALAASAAGVSLMALAQPAEAKIVYTPANLDIGQNDGVIGFDLNHDGIADFGLSNRQQYSTSLRSYFAHLKVVPKKQGNEVWGHNFGCASALPKGTRVGFKGRFYGSYPFGRYMASATFFGGSCPWDHVSPAYLGLKLVIKGKVHFGWARVNVSRGFGTISATVTGYAYETIPGKAIITGATKGPDDPEPTGSLDTPSPEPATLGALAMGAPGLSIWRRKESALEGN
jgi:hypothetical protein